MIYKTAEFNACNDCLQWLANGDATSLDYYYPDTATYVLERIQEGEKLLTDRHGRLHTTDRTEGCSECACCGRYVGHMQMAVIEAYANAVGKTLGDNTRYADHRFILSAEINMLWWQSQGLSYTASGYGRKIPTRYIVRCADSRKRRVYAIVAGNSGSLFIMYKGERLFINVEAEMMLEEVRDNGGR